MEVQLKFDLLLPLKEMALRKVVVLLWSGSDVLASISKFRFRDVVLTNYKRRQWRGTLERKITYKVSKLGLPETLAKKIIDLVRPIGFEIIRWKFFYNERYFDVEIGLPGSTKLCWTTVGRIDYRRTAEELVRCEEISVAQRYEIACDHCLEDCISLLWEELPEEKKDNFLNEQVGFLNLQYHWPHILKGEQSNLEYLWISKVLTSFNQYAFKDMTSFNQWAFEYSVIFRMNTAAEYFFQKLTHEERGASLMRSAHDLLKLTNKPVNLRERSKSFRDESICDVMCYLLSLMTPEEQMQSIKAHPIYILMIFLRWPLQELFLENASLIWTFIPPSDYDDLLSRIFHRFKESEHYFPKLFPEFFQEFLIRSPLAFKKDFVSYDCAYHILSSLIDFEDSESIEVIFRNVDAADRVEFVCNRRCLELFRGAILMDRWHMVEVCLREARLSGVDKKRLEEAFVGFMRQYQLNWKDPMFERFFEFLDDTYESADKQKKAQKRKICPEE